MLVVTDSICSYLKKVFSSNPPKTFQELLKLFLKITKKLMISNFHRNNQMCTLQTITCKKLHAFFPSNCHKTF